MGEDGELTFAGLHETILNVPVERILDAYKSVIASLYSIEALMYRRDHNLPLSKMYMGVGCLVMVHAVASGVVYSLDPLAAKSDHVVITAAPGYGKSVVEGRHPVDRFALSRKTPHAIVSKTIANKETMYVSQSKGGIKLVSVPSEQKNRPSVSDGALRHLTDLALHVERFMKCAQDIEWAVDSEERVYLLQCRPLRLSDVDIQENVPHIVDTFGKHSILFQGRGEVACRGIGAGRVSLVQFAENDSQFPDGAILVSKDASPQLSKLISRASAVITDIGSATGHFATIAREYRVPAIVNTSTATTTLQDGMEITVDAEENIVYKGIVQELLQWQLLRSSSYNDTVEFRILRRLLKSIAPPSST